MLIYKQTLQSALKASGNLGMWGRGFARKISSGQTATAPEILPQLWLKLCGEAGHVPT